MKLEGEPGVFLCNRPTASALEDRKTCEGIYRELGRMMRRHPGWSLCAITSDPTFEPVVRPPRGQEAPPVPTDGWSANL